MNQIQAWDYVVLSLILFISISIGLYHGFKEKLKKIWFIFKRKNKIDDETSVESETNNNGKTTDYLIATSSMRTIPVAFSLLATYYSATSLLGFPAEIYQYGIQYWLAVFAQSLAPIIGAFVTLPFLANFNIISVFEYFELRFDRSKYVRLVAVGCYFIRNLISCAIFMYGPATSLALLVNFDEKICIAMIGVIATFYTTIGGIRGVIWNDLFQALIMFATLILIVTKGIIDVGGFSNMLEINRVGGRLDLFDFNPDPFIRQSFWSLTLGQVFLNLMSYCFDQQSLQRFRATKTRKKAQRALLINSPAAFILVSLCCTAGLCLYANFVGCDPITNPNPNEKIQNPNQLMGYFVLNNLGSYPGVGGLFLGAIFCASLSSVSSVLSSQASIVWQDFLKLFEYFRSFDDSKSLLTNKIVVILCGLLCTGLAFLVSTIGGNLAQISAGLNGAFNAPLVGLFLLSMFFSVTTPLGAIVGTLVGFICSAWVAFGAIIVKPIYPALNVSVELCDLNGNFNTDYYSNRAVAANELTGFSKFYALSYTWYATFGILATLISGLIASLLSGGFKKSSQAKEYVYFDFCCCLFGCSKRSNQQTDE